MLKEQYVDLVFITIFSEFFSDLLCIFGHVFVAIFLISYWIGCLLLFNCCHQYKKLHIFANKELVENCNPQSGVFSRRVLFDHVLYSITCQWQSACEPYYYHFSKFIDT